MPARTSGKKAAPPGGAEPLSPQRKWRAVALASVLLVPAFWAILAGLVSGSDVAEGGPNAPAALALGLALIPFVFMLLAFMSQHPRAPGAVVRAMGLALLVGIPVSALAADGATGIVAGVGAGGVVALRSDAAHSWQSRAVAVLIGTAYTFILLRTAGAITLLPAPVFPFTAIALADHFAERKRDRTVPQARK